MTFLHLKRLPALRMHRIPPIVTLYFREFWSRSPIQHNQVTLKKFGIKEKNNPQCESLCEQEFLVKLKNDPDIFGYTKSMLDKGDQVEEQFLKEKVLPSQQLTTKKYADLIKSLIEQRKIKEAIHFLEIKILKEDQFKPSNYLYNLLLGACGRVGYTKKAFSLFNDMKKRGLKATGGTYTALFNACANSPWASTDGLSRAKNLRNTMIEKIYEPNDSNYNAMIKAFGRCGDICTAFRIVDEMMSKNMRINNDSINFLLQACITDKESGFRHALLVWRKMIKLNIKPSIFTFNLMLRSIRDCSIGSTEVTQDVISQILKEQYSENLNKLFLDCNDEKLVLEMRNSNVPFQSELQVISINNLNPNLMAIIPKIGNLISLSEVKKAEDRLLIVGGMRGYFENMKQHECDPTIKTYTLLLDVIPNTAAAENDLLSVMNKRGVLFDIDFFNMVIKKRSLRHDYQSAKDVLKLMSKYNFRPNLITYGVLALGCKSKNEALELLAEIKSSKYRLNTEILGAMLYQGCYHKNFPYILEIMETCIRDEIQPNKKFIEHLDNFTKLCRQIIKNKDDDFGQRKSFKMGFQIFRMRYKVWLTHVKIEDSDDMSPWQQFEQDSDLHTDKYYREKERASKFKPRSTSKFGWKTSPKYFQHKI